MMPDASFVDATWFHMGLCVMHFTIIHFIVPQSVQILDHICRNHDTGTNFTVLERAGGWSPIIHLLRTLEPHPVTQTYCFSVLKYQRACLL